MHTLFEQLFTVLIGFSSFSNGSNQKCYFQVTVEGTVHHGMAEILVPNEDGSHALKVIESFEKSSEDVCRNRDATHCTYSAIATLPNVEAVFNPRHQYWEPIYISNIAFEKQNPNSVIIGYRVAFAKTVDLKIFTTEEESFTTAIAFRDPDLMRKRNREEIPFGWGSEFWLIVNGINGAEVDLPPSAKVMIRIDECYHESWFLLEHKKAPSNSFVGFVVKILTVKKWILRTEIDGHYYYGYVSKILNNRAKPATSFLQIMSVNVSNSRMMRLYRNFPAGNLTYSGIETNANTMKNSGLALEVEDTSPLNVIDPENYSWYPINISKVESFSYGITSNLFYENCREFSIEIFVTTVKRKRLPTTTIGKAIIHKKVGKNQTLSAWIGPITLHFNQSKEFTYFTRIKEAKGDESPVELLIRQLDLQIWRRVFVHEKFIGLGSLFVGEMVKNQIILIRIPESTTNFLVVHSERKIDHGVGTEEVTFWIAPVGKDFRILLPANIDEFKREITVEDVLKRFHFFPTQKKSPKIQNLISYLQNSENEFGINRKDNFSIDSCISLSIDKIKQDKKKIVFSYKYTTNLP